MSHADHAHHDHPKHLAHHWDNSQQQFDAGKLGMWLFLATEVLLFGGLFCGYAVWRMNHPELFRFGSQFLDRTMGATNTVVLILSSLTMAWAVTAAQKGQQALLRILLVLTLAGACGFLVIKYFEYSHKFHEGYYPGAHFYDKPDHSHTWEDGKPVATFSLIEADIPTVRAEQAEGLVTGSLVAQAPALDHTLPPTDAPNAPVANAPPAGINEVPTSHHVEPVIEHQPHPLQDPARPPNAHVFFNIYFMMTGLHGVHVLVGMIVIIWLLVRSMRGDFGKEYFTPVDLGGLYWHIVDLIWIFLFPLFYLI